jgi:hypothetical protein
MKAIRQQKAAHALRLFVALAGGMSARPVYPVVFFRRTAGQAAQPNCVVEWKTDCTVGASNFEQALLA